MHRRAGPGPPQRSSSAPRGRAGQREAFLLRLGRLLLRRSALVGARDDREASGRAVRRRRWATAAATRAADLRRPSIWRRSPGEEREKSAWRPAAGAESSGGASGWEAEAHRVASACSPGCCRSAQGSSPRRRGFRRRASRRFGASRHATSRPPALPTTRPQWTHAASLQVDLGEVVRAARQVLRERVGPLSRCRAVSPNLFLRVGLRAPPERRLEVAPDAAAISAVVPKSVTSSSAARTAATLPFCASKESRSTCASGSPPHRGDRAAAGAAGPARRVERRRRRRAHRLGRRRPPRRLPRGAPPPAAAPAAVGRFALAALDGAGSVGPAG